MPFPEHDGVLVEPGTQTSIALKKRTIQRLGIVDHTIYKAKYSDCLDALVTSIEESAKRDAYVTNRLDVAYSRTGCINTCKQRAVIEECGVAILKHLSHPPEFYNFNFNCSVSIGPFPMKELLLIKLQVFCVLLLIQHNVTFLFKKKIQT